MGKFSDGTKVSGYVTAEENKPPRQCNNCKWYRRGDQCTHPVVIADKEVPKLDNGNAAIQDDGCCNNFQNR